jgi:hypothetical protein
MEQANIRQKLFGLVGKYWWVLLMLIGVLGFTTNVPIFRLVLWGVGIIFALMIFAPFLLQLLLQLFAPAFVFIALLREYCNKSKGQSAGKRYIFIPAALLASFGFVTAQFVLSIWVLIVSVLIWSSTIGFFFTFIATFFFGLAPLTIFTAPFVVWYKAGFAEFLAIAIFFLISAFWYGLSKLAFSENYWKHTPDEFLGYSHQAFLLGALSFQVIALPFYRFGLFGTGNIISDAGGSIFLLFALISAFQWRAIKKKLSEEEKENLYKPSVWVYIFGFLLTNLLHLEFKQSYGAPTAVLFWLNSFFLVVMIGRFFGIFKRKKPKIPQSQV